MMKNFNHKKEKIKEALESNKLFGLKLAMDFASDYAPQNTQIRYDLISLKNTDFDIDDAISIVSQITFDESILKIHNNTILEAKNITKIYKKSFDFKLSDISFKLKFGEITSLVGENSSGKTTIMSIISGEIQKTHGILTYPYLHDELGFDEDDWFSKKQHIVFIPQELPRWDGKLIDNLYLQLSIMGKNRQEIIDEVDFLLHRLDLERFKDASWDEISGGYKMRFTLAKALLNRPKLLILDEPLANLDINTQKLFLQDIRDISNSLSQPMSVLISSQHLHEIEIISDNLIFLKEGKALYNGKKTDFGKDRDENIFELIVNNSFENIKKALQDIPIQSISKSANIITIVSPLLVEKNIILQELINSDEQIDIINFRDISNSTKKLF